MKLLIWKASSGLCHYESHFGRHPNMKCPRTSPVPLPSPPVPYGLKFRCRWHIAATADCRGQSRRTPSAAPPEAPLIPSVELLPAHTSMPTGENSATVTYQAQIDTGPPQTQKNKGQSNNQFCKTTAHRVRRAPPNGHIVEQTWAT